VLRYRASASGMLCLYRAIVWHPGDVYQQSQLVQRRWKNSWRCRLSAVVRTTTWL